MMSLVFAQGQTMLFVRKCVSSQHSVSAPAYSVSAQSSLGQLGNRPLRGSNSFEQSSTGIYPDV